jgi:hypothetical protein
VQRFTPTSDAAEFRYAGSFPGPTYGFGPFGGRVDEHGRYFFRRAFGRIPDQRYFYIVFDSSGTTLDTLEVPSSVRMPVASAILRTSPAGGRMIPGLSRAPFSPVPSWDLTPDGRLLLAEGDAYAIVEIDGSGDTVRILRGSATPRAVPPAEYRDSLRDVRARIAAAGVPLERLEGVAEEIASARLRRTLPQVLGVHTDVGGRIWIERWPPEGYAGSTYDAFSREGTYLRTVLFPVRFVRTPEPVFAANRVYGVVLDDDTGVQRVAVVQLPAQ